MTDCIFCKIGSREINAPLLAENKLAFAIADLHPQAPFHALVIPKNHVRNLNALSAEQRQQLLPEMFALAHQLIEQQGFGERGYRVVLNTEREGGQSVFHLHAHVLAGAQMKPNFGRME